MATPYIERPFTSSIEIDELFKALAKAQGQMTDVEATVDGAWGKYAPLSQYLEALRKPLSENGLAVFQTTKQNSEGIELTTTLAHESGQWVSSDMAIAPEKGGPQGIGSVLTYMRRYSLAAITGMGSVDDDAAGGTKTDYDKLIPEHIDQVLMLAEELFGKGKDKADAEITRMCQKLYGVDKLAQIAADQFGSAVTNLQNKADWYKKQAKKKATKKKAAAEGSDLAEKPPEQEKL